MKYTRFDDLPVWNSAIELAVKVDQFTAGNSLRGRGALKDQIQRAALSVSNNIAEGFERGTTSELLSFLYIARGSAGEVRSMLCFMEHLADFANSVPAISDLKALAESCSRQLRAWADSLQNSDIKGQRHLNDQVRLHGQQEKERDAFLQHIDRLVRGEHASD